MGLSIAELEHQSSECLPAREVMTLLGGNGMDPDVAQGAFGGLVGANVNTGDVGILNGNDIYVDDTVDMVGNDIANDVLNGNVIGSIVG